MRRSLCLLAATAVLAGCGASSAPGHSATSSSTSRTPRTTSPGSSAGRAVVAVAPRHVAVHWHTVVTGLSSPLGVTNAGDGSGRLFVPDQGGQVRIVHAGHLVASPYLNITSEVTSGGEQGLLSVAFHPGFAKHPKMYAAYTRSDGDLVVSSFRAKSAKANHIAASTERHILLVPHHGATNHNGGQLFFGKDGYLYITTGDGGSEDDAFRRADKRNNFTGKILRINVNKQCGSKHYCIPASNPYAHSTKFKREILAWGLRNPWRASLDRPTNALWIGDVGQNRFEEIDRVGTKKAHDFGWSCKEARASFNADECDHRHMTGPIHVVSHSSGSCAIIGGFVYRGSKFSSIAGGLYVYSDNCSGTVWGLRKVNSTWANAVIGSLSGGPSGFGVSQSGELYAATLDGVLHRASFTKR
jgi:glucose/arabinose dehydrogenase